MPRTRSRSIDEVNQGGERGNAGPVRQFADIHRLKVAKDECGDQIIRGRLGHIYEHGSGRLGVMFMPVPAQRPARPKLWTAAKKKLLASGFNIHQDCEDEGSALFETDNLQQARVAARLIRAKPRRVTSEAQRAVLGRARAARRVVQTLAPGGESALKTVSLGAGGTQVAPCPKGLKKLGAALE